MESADDITGLELRDFMPESVCAACRQCCTNYPGQFFPQDLGDTEEERKAKARELLLTGLYTTDDWCGDPRQDPYNQKGEWIGNLQEHGEERGFVLFLRPAMKGKEGRIYHAGYGGACTFLGPEGCTLEREDRPRVCKALMPVRGGGCSGIEKRQLALAWMEDTFWLDDLRLELLEEQERDGKARPAT